MTDNNVPQLSKEWFSLRKGRITGSRIGAILGLSPWQKPDDVLRDMVRDYHGAPTEFEGNPATRHGQMNERRAVLAFMKETGLHVDDCGFFSYGQRLGASPDGLVGDDAVVEIKVPFGLRNSAEAQFKPLAEQPHYEAQVQMELLATDRKYAYFVQYVPPKGDVFAPGYVGEQINVEVVQRDYSWIDRVLPVISEFYELYLDEIDNPQHLEPKRVNVLSNNAHDLLVEIDAIRERKKIDAAREKEIIDQLVGIAGEKDALIFGRKLTQTQGRKTIAYARAIKDLAPDADLSAYETVGKRSWRLT